VKRKPARKPATKSESPLNASPLAYDTDRLFRAMHHDGRTADGQWKPVPKSEIAGIPLPANLDEIAESIARKEAEWFCLFLTWSKTPTQLPASDVQLLVKTLADAVREGFVLALLRYAEDLKHVPNARAILEANRNNSAKGGAARRKQAEPRRQKARRLDRELRKTIKKKYLRVRRIAGEMRCSEKTIERYLEPQK
jgi:hypothetical protein